VFILCAPSVLKYLFPVIAPSLESTSHVITLKIKLYIYKLKPFVTIVLYSICYMAFEKFGKGINFVMYSLFSILIIFNRCRFQ